MLVNNPRSIVNRYNYKIGPDEIIIKRIATRKAVIKDEKVKARENWRDYL